MNNKPFPWQDEAWRQLQARRSALPHGLLVRGPRGIGKRHLAIAFGYALLCQSPGTDGTACGECGPCRWAAAGNHPDLRIVQPETAEAAEAAAGEGTEPATSSNAAKRASKLIRIEQARALQDWLGVGSHQGGWRVAIVHPAEAMNLATANALLKTLEEPPPRTLLVLVSNEPDRLLPTIRSRCQSVSLGLPSARDARAWLAAQVGVAGSANPADADRVLALFGGAPLAAAEHAELAATARELVAAWAQADIDAVGLAARFHSVPLPDVIDLLQKWTIDLANTIAGLPLRYYPQESALAERAGRGVAMADVLRLYRRFNEARRVAEHPLAPRLVLEELFIDLASLRSRA